MARIQLVSDVGACSWDRFTYTSLIFEADSRSNELIRVMGDDRFQAHNSVEQQVLLSKLTPAKYS
jgi:hypothetical protein